MSTLSLSAFIATFTPWKCCASLILGPSSPWLFFLFLFLCGSGTRHLLSFSSLPFFLQVFRINISGSVPALSDYVISPFFVNRCFLEWYMNSFSVTSQDLLTPFKRVRTESLGKPPRTSMSWTYPSLVASISAPQAKPASLTWWFTFLVTLFIFLLTFQCIVLVAGCIVPLCIYLFCFTEVIWKSVFRGGCT